MLAARGGVHGRLSESCGPRGKRYGKGGGTVGGARGDETERKRASRKAKASAVGFAGATMMSRLPFMQIGQRFDYLAAGSPSAAINLTGNDAVLLNNSR